MKVGIIFGSKSDVDVMKGAADCLKKFGIEYSAHILSAHRVPELLEETLEKFEKEGYGVIIAGAGLAAHLPGVIASKTILPVVGVPNSYNAGMLAVEILAVGNKELRAKLLKFRKEMKEDFKKNIHIEL